MNMTLEQLGKKLNMTKQGVKRIEESEAAGTLTLKSLKEVGNALEMKFIYGFVPIDGSIDHSEDHWLDDWVPWCLMCSDCKHPSTNYSVDASPNMSKRKIINRLLGSGCLQLGC